MKSPGVLAVLCLVGCGDNSNQCGPGTEEKDGVCEPVGGAGLICGDGTILDELTDECVPDPSVCGGGTVLINGECKDPADGLPIDVQEGAEPNGFEVGAVPAGILTIKDVGEPLVIHGCITPLGNNSPDLDVYQFEVAGPTLLHITADGVQGLAAGYLVLGEDRLGSWFRLGISIASDTSKREVFLPVGGRYQLVMADTRTLLPLTNNGEGFPAAGNPDGTSCYFVTVNRRAIPTAAPLDLTAPNVGTIGEDLKFFTATFQTGINTMVAVIDPEDLDGDGNPDLDALGNPIDSHAASSIVLVNNDRLRQINDANADSPISSALFGGIKQGDVPLVILDYVWNYTVSPADFRIEMLDQTSSLPLGATPVTDTSNGQEFSVDGEAVFDNVNLFHFDVAAGGEIEKMAVTFSIPVQGSIVDEDGGIVSNLTGLSSTSGGVPFVETFTQYQGLFRPFAPGRHYFFMFAPRSPVGTSFTATGAIAPIAPTPVDATPTTPVPFNDVRSNMFVHDSGAVPWRTFNATAEAGVGALDVSFYDPTVANPQTPGFAFGRLDTLITTRDADPPGPKAGEATPLFQPTFEADGSTPLHAVLRNPFAALPAATTTFLVKVNPTIASPTGTFSLAFPERDITDVGTLAAGQSQSFPFTMVAGGEERLFVQTAPGHEVTITVAPTGSQPTLDVVLEVLAGPETAIETFDDNGNNAGETRVATQNLSGATAFRIRGSNNTRAGAYTVTVAVEATGYTVTQEPAGFSDACLGGTFVALEDVAGFGGDDEGLSAVIPAPTGFALFGNTVTQVRVSSNGFLTTNLAITDPLAVNGLLDSDPSVSIAPQWDDLGFISVCQKTLSGGRLAVQWDGLNFDSGSVVQFQAILDGNGTITFVYGPRHSADGSTATIGVQGGGNTLQFGADSPLVGPASSITLTPN